MATISANTSNGKFQISLTVTESSYSTAENTSLVSWSFQIKSLGLGGFGDYGIPRTATINGTNVVNSSAYTSCYNNQTTSWGSGSLTIPHNDDGSKTISISFSATGLGDYSWNGTVSQSGSVQLTTIPRASTLTLTASSLTITNATATLGFTATSKGNFYHKLSWKVGSSSSSVVSGWNPKQINTTSASGTINTGAILDKMPTSTSGTLTFTLETFTDSAMTNKTGTSTATCSISINTSNIKPAVSLGTIGVNTPSSFTNLVAGYSTAKVTVTSTNSRGASSFSTSFTISKGSLSANSTSATSYTLKTNTLPSGTSNYTFTITATVTDSRGVSASTSKTSGTVYGYATPVISAQFYRVAESGSSTADPIGGYVYRSFSATQSYTVNGWNNTLTVTAKQDGTTVTSGTTSALADTSSATLVVTATDKVTTVTKTLTVGTATFPLDLYDNAQGTVGVGMGTTAEGGLVQSNMDIRIVKDNQTMVRGYADTGNIYARGEIGTSSSIYSAGEIKGDADVLAKGGFYSLPTGQVGTPTSANGMLLIKRASASADGTPNNGVVLEFGNSTTRKGQLFIADNGSEGVWTGGWYNGTHQAWRRLFESNDYLTNNNTVQTGMAVHSNRCSIYSGGYVQQGKMVFFHMELQIKTSLSANNYWTLLTGLPKPQNRDAAMSVSGYQLKGVFNAYVSTAGELIVNTGSLALANGNHLLIGGFYFIA